MVLFQSASPQLASTGHTCTCGLKFRRRRTQSSDIEEFFQTGGDPGNNNNVQATYSPQAQELEHSVPRQCDINWTRSEALKQSGLL